MRIRLISPSARKYTSGFREWKQPKAHRYPGLGLITVAALCPPDMDIKIIDDDYQEIDYEEEIDIVGISLLTCNAYRAYEVSKNYRNRGIPVVLGGMHVTACPEEALSHADSIVIGEAEDTWPVLLKDFNNGRLKKVYRSTNSSDLSNIPFPRRDLLDKNRFATINTVQATRGCSFNCEFCSIVSLFGSKIRVRPLEEVIEEIRSLEGNVFLLNDDNLAQMNEYYKQLFSHLIPLKKHWVGEASSNIVNDKEMLELMERSGCTGLFIGFESLETQKGYKKLASTKNKFLLYKNVVKKLHDHNINVVGAFIFGFDNDTELTFERALEFALESRIDAAQLNILTPYPGTPLYERLEREGRIIERKWNYYRSCHICFTPKKISPSNLLEKYVWLKRKFYAYRLIASRVIRAIPRTSLSELAILLGVNLGSRKSLKTGLNVH